MRRVMHSRMPSPIFLSHNHFVLRPRETFLATIQNCLPAQSVRVLRLVWPDLHDGPVTPYRRPLLPPPTASSFHPLWRMMMMAACHDRGASNGRSQPQSPLGSLRSPPLPPAEQSETSDAPAGSYTQNRARNGSQHLRWRDAWMISSRPRFCIPVGLRAGWPTMFHVDRDFIDD